MCALFTWASGPHKELSEQRSVENPCWGWRLPLNANQTLTQNDESTERNTAGSMSVFIFLFPMLRLDSISDSSVLGRF